VVSGIFNIEQRSISGISRILLNRGKNVMADFISRKTFNTVVQLERRLNC
jgi:hypothetical protein